MKDKEQLMLSLSTKEDLDKLNDKIKYVDIDITNPHKEIIDYLLTNGKKLLITYRIEETKSYIYIDYLTFKKGQLLIEEILKSIPKGLNDLQKCRYLYIKLGSFVGYDINTIENKNEILNLSTIHIINNIWGAITNGKCTNKSITELFYYLCRLLNIQCKIVTINEFGYRKNIVTIDNTEMILDITQDIPYIQSGFQTRFFGTYNNDEELDKTIGYLKGDYNEKKIEQALKKIDFTTQDTVKQILLHTQNIINVSNIQPIELGIIYSEIFSKYCPNQDISISNLYINSNNQKEHFILFTHNNKHYSFNYSKNTFVEMQEAELTQYIENKTIGIYNEEKNPLLNSHKLKIA